MAWTARFGQCRCCLNFGYHKDIAEPYHRNGARETYRETFLKCFYLVLSKNEELTHLICRCCIHRLQDASDFKSMVMASERQLLSDIGISNMELVDMTQHDETNIGYNTSKKDKTNVILEKQYDVNIENNDDPIESNDETIENNDETIKNNDITIESDDITIESDDITINNDDDTIDFDGTIENDDDDAIIQEEDDNYVLLIVGDETDGTEELAHDKTLGKDHDKTLGKDDDKTLGKEMATTPPCGSDCGPPDHSYARTHRRPKNIYSDSLRPRKPIKNSAVDESIRPKLKNKTLNKDKKADTYTLSESKDMDDCNIIKSKITNKKCKTKQTNDTNTKFSTKKTIIKTSSENINVRKGFQQNKHKKLSVESKDVGVDSILKHSCNLCKYVTSNSVHYQSHLKAHSAAISYVCDFCCYIATKKIDLTNHLLTHTGVKPYACNVCKKKFNRRQTLGLHLRTHTGEKPYACEYCDKKFRDNAGILAHKRTHTSEKPYTCNICHKEFNSRSSYANHVRRHYSRKLYACEICDKKLHAASLSKHMLRHTNVKPYACELCDSKFYHNDELSAHMKTHNKPYSCSVCGKGFARKSRLTEHFTLHTGEKPYACKLCQNKLFRSKRTLSEHMRMRHKRKKSL